LASELTPKFTPPTPAKWTGLFSINLETENGIPLNKRGSVVRRLVLVSFFKAEAERRLNSGSKRSIIYAVEEPETAQHPKNQKILIDAFETLLSEDGCQVILTTHSPGLAGDLPSESIRFVTRDETNKPLISGGVDVFEHVADTLGVIPDSRVKVLFYVEGPNDVIALKHLSKALHEEDQTIIDLDMDKRVSFVSTGGSSLLHWVTEHYLKNFNCPEFHLYDNDKPEYGKAVDEVNARGDGSWATQTKKREIENYLHTDAIKEVYGVQINIPDDLDDDGKDVPKLFSEAIYNPERDDAPMKDSAAKKRLTKAFKAMTAVRIRERDPEGEVESWFRKLSEMMTA
jgi:predicted ATP-dependent endonuclease of OLD family